MKKKLIVISILILLIFTSNISNAQSEYIDVKISSYIDGKEVGIKSVGGLKVVDDSFNTINQFPEDEFKVLVSGSSLTIKNIQGRNLGEYNIEQVLLTSVDKEEISISNSSYRGYIRFINKKSKSIINHLKLEEYLYGVLPREMSPSFPIEALKSQAIASRSFALSNINKHASEGYNLCNTTHCQVYSGKSVEKESTNKAIDATVGLAAYYKGEIAQTNFHSTNGGYVESSFGAWGVKYDYLIAKEDKFSINTENANWTLEYTKQELNKKLRAAGINVGELKYLDIISRTDGKRVKELKIVGTLKEEIITGNRLRNILGNTTMKSTWFYLDDSEYIEDEIFYAIIEGRVQPLELNSLTVLSSGKSAILNTNQIEIYGRKLNTKDKPNRDSNKIVFEGKGYGHGVGMSQRGAKNMADLGYKYTDIIKHYYPGVEIY